MRNTAREAALNIVFAQQFNDDCMDLLKSKVYKQFALTKKEDIDLLTKRPEQLSVEEFIRLTEWLNNA